MTGHLLRHLMFAVLVERRGPRGLRGVSLDGRLGRDEPDDRARGGIGPSDRAPLSRDRSGGRARAVRVHEGPARGPRSLRRMGEARAAARPCRGRRVRRAALLHGRQARGRARRPGPHQGADDRPRPARARLRRVRPRHERLGRRQGRARRARPGLRRGRRSSARRNAVVREVGGVKVGFVGYGQTKGQDATGVEDAVERGRRGREEARSAGARGARRRRTRRGEAHRRRRARADGGRRRRPPGRTGTRTRTAPQGEQVGNVLIVQAVEPPPERRACSTSTCAIRSSPGRC